MNEGSNTILLHKDEEGRYATTIDIDIEIWIVSSLLVLLNWNCLIKVKQELRLEVHSLGQYILIEFDASLSF
jgi:hypothetical protein